MKPFPNKPRGTFVGKGQWKLIRPFVYNSRLKGKITVPIDTITDGASIPRFLWCLLGSPWSGRYAPGAIVHDFLYQEKKFTRKEADLVFLESMEVLKVPLWKRRVMYRALRLFGGFAYRR